MFWLFLIFYGLPATLSAYAIPNTCDTYQSNSNLCCTPNVNCLVSQGGIYLPGGSSARCGR